MRKGEGELPRTRAKKKTHACVSILAPSRDCVDGRRGEQQVFFEPEGEKTQNAEDETHSTRTWQSKSCAIASLNKYCHSRQNHLSAHAPKMLLVSGFVLILLFL